MNLGAFTEIRNMETGYDGIEYNEKADVLAKI